MKSSNRGTALTSSPIRQLIPYARAAKAEGKEVLHLNIGQPDIKTPKTATEAVKANNSDVITYGASEGLLSLRQTVAQYYRKFGVDISADNVLVTTGASEAIQFSLFSCFDPGDEIIIPEPFYANYLGYAQMSGIKIIPIATSLEAGFELPTAEAFEALLTPKTKGIFLCNPSNPTGRLYSQAALEALANLVKKRKLYLIVDEVYREFCYDDTFYSVLNLREIVDNVIVIDSISKVFSSCGARIGYMLTRNREIISAVIKYAQLRLCPPYFGQILAEKCYEDSEDYLSTVKNEYDLRRQYLYSRFSQIEGIKTYLPQAAFYNVVELPVANAADFCKWMLTDFDLDGTTIMMAPCEGFYINKTSGIQQVRIAYVLSKDKLAKAMDCLEAGLKIYNR